MYYISEVLHDTKTRYLEVHKLHYTVLITSRKLCHYFQAHKISVVSSYPWRVVLHNPNATGNIAKWVAELVELKLDFILHHVVEREMLAGFVADWMLPPCHPGARTMVSWSSELRSSPSHTGLSSSMAPCESRGLVQGSYSSI
jgi:hypothetical protein